MRTFVTVFGRLSRRRGYRVDPTKSMEASAAAIASADARECNVGAAVKTNGLEIIITNYHFQFSKLSACCFRSCSVMFFHLSLHGS